jgi:Uma2 family endonuclease
MESGMPISYRDSFGLTENPLEEIVRGESRVMPPASLAHARLLKKLDQLLSAGGELEIIGPGVGLGITKDPFTYRIPDKMAFRSDIWSRSTEDDLYVWETPELIAECLSPANRKGLVEELLADYDRIQAPEVWLIYPEQKTVDVLRRTDNLRSCARTKTGCISPYVQPELRIPLDELWDAFTRR